MSGTDAHTVRTHAVVRSRLRANGDWNVNDWRDAARVLLADFDEAVKALAEAAAAAGSAGNTDSEETA